MTPDKAAHRRSGNEHKEKHMDLEDLLKGRHRKHRYDDHDHHHHDDHHGQREHGYGDHRYYGGHHHCHYKLEMLLSLYRKLPHKKALIAAVIIVVALLIVLGVSILLALLPLAARLLEYAGAGEIQNLLKTLLALVPLLNG
jgi:hypothetical protein